MLGIRRSPRDGPRRDRRRTDRRAAGWESRYVVADHADELWFLAEDKNAACVVRNVSVAGACLELPTSDVSVGDRVVLDLQLGDRRRASIRLAADVRHATRGDDGQVMAGVEFDAVGDLERALLLRLVRDLESSERRAG
jgi:PilZ domain